MKILRGLLAALRRPYTVVAFNPELGMVAIRWRDDPDRTHWLTPAHLAQQKGQHR
ncbi:hypothetical protein ACQEVF_32310 [Nonomuraea polychroma]|uniref:hypothetical protein n=1 Tax=Nonomuraea polychroma TaxID=46176 RepID=UPI003D92ED0B